MVIQQLSEKNLSKVSAFIARKKFGKVEAKKVRYEKGILEHGHGSTVRKEKTFFIKVRNAVTCTGTLVLFQDGFSEVRNFYFESTVTAKQMRGFVARMLDVAKVNQAKKTRMTVPLDVEKFFSKLNFEKVGELQEDGGLAVMDFRPKKEKQVDLSKKLADTSLMEEVASKTAEQLRKLRAR